MSSFPAIILHLFLCLHKYLYINDLRKPGPRKPLVFKDLRDKQAQKKAPFGAIRLVN